MLYSEVNLRRKRHESGRNEQYQAMNFEEQGTEIRDQVYELKNLIIATRQKNAQMQMQRCKDAKMQARLLKSDAFRHPRAGETSRPKSKGLHTPFWVTAPAN